MALAVYHERQEAALCGMHCLNNLIQAPNFDVDQLMQIAQGLDSLVYALPLQTPAESRS